MQTRTAVVGAGALGLRFARGWRARHPDSSLLCTVKRESSRARVDALGLSVEVLDLLGPEFPGQLFRGVGFVLCCVAPGPEGGEAVWSRGVSRLVEELDEGAHLVHVSSTGVYRAGSGEVVDEQSPTGVGERARALLAAEQAVLGARHLRATVLRCSGLVSAERGPQRVIERLAGSERGGRDDWLNLVWIDDVVEAVTRAFERRIGGLYNLSGPALRRGEFYDPLVQRAGLAPIRWNGDTEVSGRRVDVSRFVETFGFRPREVRPEDLAV